MDRIEKSWKELDFDVVDFSSGSGWTWGMGGYPLETGEYSISMIEDDYTDIRYTLPKCINDMLTTIEKWGKDDALSNVRRSLGI